MGSNILEGCTTGVVRIKGKLYLFKTNDVQPKAEEEPDEAMEVIMPQQKEELKQKGINFTTNWPEKDYLSLGAVYDHGKDGKWLYFTGGMSKNIGFGAAGAHSVEVNMNDVWNKWQKKEWNLYNMLRQGSIGLNSLDKVEKLCRSTAEEISLYTNYVYCSKDGTIVVEFKGDEVEVEKLGNKKFLVRANHYQLLDNDIEPQLKDADLSLKRYNHASKGLKKAGAVNDLMKLMCEDPINKYSVSAYVCCVETGGFWYTLKKPEKIEDFVKLQLEG